MHTDVQQFSRAQHMLHTHTHKINMLKHNNSARSVNIHEHELLTGDLARVAGLVTVLVLLSMTP